MMLDLLAQRTGLTIQTGHSSHARVSCTRLKSDCEQLYFEAVLYFFVFVSNFGKAAP